MIAVLTSTGIAALALAAPVLGDGKTFRDPKGDSTRGPNLDFKRASHGHEDGRLRHTAVVWGSARRSKEHHLQLQIWTRAGGGAEYVWLPGSRFGASRDDRLLSRAQQQRDLLKAVRSRSRGAGG